jgi:hypothetical protein
MTASPMICLAAAITPGLSSCFARTFAFAGCISEAIRGICRDTTEAKTITEKSSTSEKHILVINMTQIRKGTFKNKRKKGFP